METTKNIWNFAKTQRSYQWDKRAHRIEIIQSKSRFRALTNSDRIDFVLFRSSKLFRKSFYKKMEWGSWSNNWRYLETIFRKNWENKKKVCFFFQSILWEMSGIRYQIISCRYILSLQSWRWRKRKLICGH